MPQVYILFYARNLEIKSDEIFLFVRVPPMNSLWNIGFQKKFQIFKFSWKLSNVRFLVIWEAPWYFPKSKGIATIAS